jgi:hypothetical protein
MDEVEKGKISSPRLPLPGIKPRFLDCHIYIYEMFHHVSQMAIQLLFAKLQINIIGW